ncbi:glycosyltransferase family 2 protein [Streptococcus sp. 263_SSPC]|uniref:glycosyltransferase family 2 protein n=1 Tax=Streptococcus sp. 263_SSPC TaxID=1579343 RepID=UPI000660FA37|nr:glycosyltransferase family 2 protein [Streptococcus sp. 263_SSPC]
MKVSIIITARNEEKYLPMLFKDILNQTYPLQNIEVVLMDSNSKDNTRTLMEEFKTNNESLSVQIVTNERQIQAAGFNEGVKHATGDVVLKIDAHSRIPADFVQKNVNEIMAGAYVCGGNRPTVVDSDDDFSKTLHIVEESALGSSIANYRKSNTKRKVNSIFHGMYRKEVFEKVGLADERLLRTEDNEFHYRVRKSGYDIIFNPEIESYQYIRPTFIKMIKQKFANGYWIGLTSHICRDCLSLFHFGPGVFVATLLVLMMLTPISFAPLLTVFGLYLLAVLGLSILEISKQKFNPTLLLIPFIMMAVHFAYGIGTIKGWIFGFEFKKEYFSEEEKS